MRNRQKAAIVTASGSKFLIAATDGTKRQYRWECGPCGAGWQVTNWLAATSNKVICQGCGKTAILPRALLLKPGRPPATNTRPVRRQLSPTPRAKLPAAKPPTGPPAPAAMPAAAQHHPGGSPGTLIKAGMSKLACCVCFDRAPDHVMSNCGHCFCSECGDGIAVCALCKKRSSKTVKLLLLESAVYKH